MTPTSTWFTTTTTRRGDAVVAVLKRPGFAVRIGPDGVSEPFRADDALLRRIYEAFVPVVPEDDGSTFEYAGDPLNQSGQGAQEGDDYQQFAENKHEQDDENTENKPEQPSVDEDDDIDPPPPPPVEIDVGDILPLDILDDFADAQVNNPDGVLFAIAPAQVDNGSRVENGVVIFQIHVDWASRTVAPEALASFVKFDFTVTDPDDLTQANQAGYFPGQDFAAAYLAALFDSAGIPFSGGDNDLAVFLTPTYTLTIRQGENDTVTADISVDYDGSDGNFSINLAGGIDDLQFSPGEGELAYFTFPLGYALSGAEFEAYGGSGVQTMSGVSTNVISTLGDAAPLTGVTVAQIEVDFDNRTVGGGSSFIAVAAAADPATGGANTVAYVALDQAAPFDSGLFGLAFYTVASISNDPNALKGQVIFSASDGLDASLASIIADGAGNHLYTENELSESFGATAISTIAELEALAGDLGAGTYRYDSLGRGAPGVVGFRQANGVFSTGNAEASIDINFANRTVGGGASYVGVSIDDTANNFSLSFTEILNAVSFDDAAAGAGVFGFGADDFSGANMQNALFLIRDGDADAAGAFADIYFNFTDGAGGEGTGQIDFMPRNQGATVPPIP